MIVLHAGNPSRRIIRFRWNLSTRLRNELSIESRQSDLRVAKHLHGYEVGSPRVLGDLPWGEISSPRKYNGERGHLSAGKLFFPFTSGTRHFTMVSLICIYGKISMSRSIFNRARY